MVQFLAGLIEMAKPKVFVIGGAGSIGSELVKQLSIKNDVIAIDIDETGLFDLNTRKINPEIGNIRDYRRMRELFELYKPDIVFNAAAYKHLSHYEKENFSELIETNVNGMINVLRLVKEFKVKKFVFISTDKAVNPTSLMGTTKLIGEIMTRRCGHIAVRFGNVLGSRGSVIPIWQRQIEMGNAITVTDTKMERFFMSIQEACELVIEASKIGKGGEIFILDMGKPIKIIDLATKIIKESGRDIKIVITGAKQGEKLNEELMTQDEKLKSIKRGKLYVIKG